ncbi:MAG: hypothetical protein P8O03_03105 [Ilumatobacter sp.]|nr:hypothetical protein [Ilumatobacter sp.]
MKSYSDSALVAAIVGAILLSALCAAGFSYLGRQFESLQADFCEALTASILLDLETGTPEEVVAIREIIANSDSECFD